jgi:uncharacterized protein (DUF488 family)
LRRHFGGLKLVSPRVSFCDNIARTQKRFGVSFRKMLNRQKVVLALMANERDTIGRVRLFKYAFLVAKEAGLGPDFNFYHFLPYKYGPYSFALEREIQTLHGWGYIREDEGGFGIDASMSGEVAKIVRQLPADVSSAAISTASRYRSLSLDDLLRKVYSTYPQYTFNSSRPEMIPSEVKRPAPAPAAIYTLGYEGKSIDSFFDLIVRTGIQAIVDVRANPISRKYGFARRSMAGIAAKMGVRYVHIPELGISSKARKELGSVDSYLKLFAEYEDRMLPRQTAALERASEAVSSFSAALVCRESDPDFCHRGRLASTLAALTSLSVVHL